MQKTRTTHTSGNGAGSVSLLQFDANAFNFTRAKAVVERWTGMLQDTTDVMLAYLKKKKKDTTDCIIKHRWETKYALAHYTKNLSDRQSQTKE